MESAIIDRYGSANELQISETPTPTLRPSEVLVRNYYTCINPMDTKVRAGQFKFFVGRKFPKILGVESAGVVEKIGENVTAFKKGDRVMVSQGFKFGGYAAYTVVSENSVFPLPDRVSFQEGATLTMAACTAFNGLYKAGKIKDGDEVLVNGAYGGVGSFAVQLAKLAGAKVTGVCSSENIENVKALNADSIIDYTEQDIYTIDKKYDLVFDAVGKLEAWKAKRLLKKDGRMVTTVAGFKQILFSIFFPIFSSKRFKMVWNNPTREQMALLSGLVKDQKLKVIVDREYALNEVSEAHKYSETGRAKGKILIRI